ncbi:Anti-sigma regulatory factor (Ser/Thr protein kinase) [Actinacidiphila alni]|uniref:Anti-sigma regulatory factor (Ser/Thr protein kinase) n=2 Tax=Actinacidiphila alni TaxID=380248 RepID=A0A1I2LCL3_9ACTN|nr:Anti-sigma regulatory factor (Ser/Thr protein kinase) [Actinacidiphila alni]
MLHTDCSVAGQPASSADARQAVLALIDRGCPAAGRTDRIDVSLMITELIANAFRHAGNLVLLEARVSPDTVDICVSDRDTRLPAPRPATDAADGPGGEEGGFGWPMVLALASSVTVTRPASGGKRIRVLLHLVLPLPDPRTA